MNILYLTYLLYVAGLIFIKKKKVNYVCVINLWPNAPMANIMVIKCKQIPMYTKHVDMWSNYRSLDNRTNRSFEVKFLTKKKNIK